MKRILSFLIITAMIMSLLASCGNTDEKNEKDSAKKEQENATTVAVTGENSTEVTDGLPAGLKFPGETFTILSREEGIYGEEMGSETETGEIVGDAIYRRNKTVEERLDITINVIKIPGVGANVNNFLDTVRNNVNAGDDTYDLIAGYTYYITPLATEGMFANLKNFGYLDFDKPWWSAELADKLTIDDKLYFMTGDLSMTLLSSLMVIYFNKQLQKDYAAPDLYQIVLDGGWTYDKMFEISKGMYSDVDGDSTRNDKDIYGMTYEIGNYNDAFFVSQNQPITQRNADGSISLVMKSEKSAEIINRLYDLCYNNPGVFAVSEDNKPGQAMFKNGQSLLNPGRVEFSGTLFRDMEIDYGIIPMPKYDSAQEKYMSMSQDAYAIFSVPATCTRNDFVGAVTEALAYESYKLVTPAYYETALKVKYSRDAVTSQMLDLAREGLQFDFAFVNSSNMDNIMHLLRELIREKDKNFTSRYEKRENVFQKKLDTLIEAYEKLP